MKKTVKDLLIDWGMAPKPLLNEAGGMAPMPSFDDAKILKGIENAGNNREFQGAGYIASTWTGKHGFSIFAIDKKWSENKIYEKLIGSREYCGDKVKSIVPCKLDPAFNIVTIEKWSCD
jgi:hypothetical protein